MNFLVSAVLVLVGLIHLVPAIGVLGRERLAALYGVAIADEQLMLLMRHRAVLFGLLGALLCAAAFHPAWRVPALWAGLVSTVSFLLLAWLGGPLDAPLRRVAFVDVGASVLLVAALVAVRVHRA